MNELEEEGMNELILCLIITIMYKTDVRASPLFHWTRWGNPPYCVYVQTILNIAAYVESNFLHL